MRVLVAYATYYGATREIARCIAEVLAHNGHEPSLHAVDDKMTVDGYDAYVIGSAVHAGRWLKPAAQFLTENAAILERAPVWLFSSGPVGEGADKPQPEPKEVSAFRRTVTVRDHVVFGGAFDRNTTHNGGWFERTVGRFIPEGDYRDWPEIEAWARDIANELKTPVAV